MNIAVTIESQKDKNLRAVAKLIARGVPFENAMGRVMRAQAKREGQKPTIFRKPGGPKETILGGGELLLLRAAPFCTTNEYAAEIGVDPKRMRAWAQSLRNRLLVFNERGHNESPARYAPTDEGRALLEKYKDVPSSIEDAQKQDSYAEIVAAFGDEPACAREISDRIGRHQNSTRVSIIRLVEAGRLREAGHKYIETGKYQKRKVKLYERVE